jgi:adenylate cyclase
MSATRKLVAILVADVVGYSQLAGADEDRTLARLRGLRSDLIDPAVAAHHGRIVKRMGDGRLIERLFHHKPRKPLKAFLCAAIEMPPFKAT